LDGYEDVKPLFGVVGAVRDVLPNLVFETVKLLSSSVNFDEKNLVVQDHSPVVKNVLSLTLIFIPIGVPMSQKFRSGSIEIRDEQVSAINLVLAVPKVCGKVNVR
jgi:hypothetical protein